MSEAEPNRDYNRDENGRLEDIYGELVTEMPNRNAVQPTEGEVLDD